MAETQKKKTTTKSPNSSCKKYSDRNMEARNKKRRYETRVKHLAKAKARAIRNAEARAGRKTTDRARYRALNVGLDKPRFLLPKKEPVVVAKPVPAKE